MKCPASPDTALVMTERQAIEIDYCPQCRGVWLDRGELDKLIERSVAPPPAAAAPPAQAVRDPRDVRRPDFVDSDYPQHRGHGTHRRKSWLSDIFD